VEFSFYQEVIAPYLLGVSQNALIGAVAGWGQQRDANRENAEQAAENERERIKPLIQRIEQKLFGDARKRALSLHKPCSHDRRIERQRRASSKI